MKEYPKKFASAEQKLRLLQLVEADPELKCGKITQSYTINEANKRWLAISHELNSIPGTKKTWREWRKTWQDKKANVKKKSAQLSELENPRDDNSLEECPKMADCLILQNFDQKSLGVQGMRRATKKYASAEQKHHLSRLVEADPQLRGGKFSKSFTKFEARRRWLVISHKLNSLPGAKKTWAEWRKTWQDRKANAKKYASLQRTNSASPQPDSPSLDDSSFLHTDDQDSLMGHDYAQETKPTFIELSQPGTSAVCTPKYESSAPKLSDVRRRADAQRQMQQELNTFEDVTVRLLREKLEIKKKFYEDYIRLMSQQTQALVDIASALNNAATMSDVLQ